MLKSLLKFGKKKIKCYIEINLIVVSEFKSKKQEMDREIERFMELLNDILPRYSSLLRKKDMSHDEVTELGELEHYLIEINAKILDIKNKIQNDLFGQTIDTYYRLKIKAKNGDEVAKSQIRKLKRIYMDALIAGSIICWN